MAVMRISLVCWDPTDLPFPLRIANDLASELSPDSFDITSGPLDGRDAAPYITI
jgi:hypothetical protein